MKNEQHTTIQGHPVVIKKEPAGGFWAMCTDIEGCYSQGETRTELLKNMEEAILLSLEDVSKKKSGRRIRLNFAHM